MRWIYQLGIYSYVFLVRIASLFNPKAKKFVLGRKNSFCQLKNQVDVSKPIAWFHVSSLGEFEQGRPVMEAFKEKFPEFKILLTFFSPSGYEVRKNYEGADYIYYLPTDSRDNARKFLDIVNPQYAFFVKYDFWYHYLKNLHQRQIPTYIFSSIFREEQLFFKPWGQWYRKMLEKFTHLFVQDGQSKKLLSSIGINNVTIGGDTRVDRVLQIVENAKSFPELEKFTKGNKVIIGGSTWEKDEALLFELIKGHSDIKLILAPHEIHDGNIERILSLCPFKAIRFTQFEQSYSETAKILIIDTMGMLSSMYRYGQMAFIGGAFGKGLHNTLEAATYGIPIVFGPNYHKFKEACDLIEKKAGFSVSDYTSFNNIVKQIFFNENARSQAGKFARNYVESMAGGTLKIIEKVTGEATKYSN
jgi:3-deoxy-D-manno-octulosonic-acid transferase